jgi:AAA+ superfamily predicted ATPase
VGKIDFPLWADEMRQIFRTETVNQFIIHGNINDYVPHREEQKLSFLPVKKYISSVLFAQFDVVIVYDRGQGIVIEKGENLFFDFLRVMDLYHGTKLVAPAVNGDLNKSFQMVNLLPRNPLQVLELIDRFANGVLQNPSGKIKSIGVIIDYAHFIAPRGDAFYLTGDIGSQLIKMLNWAEDLSIKGLVTCLLSENLLDINDLLSTSSFNAKIKIDFPDKKEIEDYLTYLVDSEPTFKDYCTTSIPVLADKLLGLNRVSLRTVILKSVKNSIPITEKYLSNVKKESIEKEAMGKLEFLETTKNMDSVAGHTEAKKWLREDAELIKRGITNAIPMGYLITGRIGTGKTHLVQCFAGECGIPFVELKNFRDKWVGGTEGNLEKIFTILHALGQVVVFVDEADQATGKRNSNDDSGVSGRIYAMLAKEMANTGNRGKIIWIFATSRPDFVEVDLKRQGRLDVHIPLFPPVDKNEKKELFFSMAKKLKINISFEDLPELPFEGPIGGNELEGLLVRAIRLHALQQDSSKALKDIISEIIKNFKPSAHTSALELMDLIAVRECTDNKFLPARFADLDMNNVEQRIKQLIY